MKQITLTNIIFLLILLLAFTSAKAQTKEIKPLLPEQTIERELAGGQTHKYKIEAKANEFLQIKVEQKGIDVVVRLFDSSGKPLTEIDSPNGTQGFENLTFIISDAGSYEIEISSLEVSATKGIYTINRKTPRLAREEDKKFVEARRLVSEAEKLKAKGDIDSLKESLAKLQKAKLLFNEIKAKVWEADTLFEIGDRYSLLGDKKKVLVTYNEALKLSIESGEKSIEGRVLLGIGSTYRDLGDLKTAVEYYERVFPIAKIIDDDNMQSLALGLTGRVYLILADKAYLAKNKEEALSNYYKAIDYFNRTLPIFEKNDDEFSQAEMLSNLGSAYSNLAQYTKNPQDIEKTKDFYNRSLSIRRKINYKNGEVASLSNLGIFYHKLNEPFTAFTYFNQALALQKTISNKNVQARMLSHLMLFLQFIGNNRLAILYGKQSINSYQNMRADLIGLDENLQKSFLTSIEKTYRTLIDLLIAEGRLIEAEQVLQILKKEEVFDYLRRDASETDKLSQRADLTAQEKDALKRYEEIADKITALGREFAEMEKLGENRTAEQEKRFGKLAAELEAANSSFQVFLRQLAEEFKKRTNTEKDLQENLALQSDLKKWGDDVVFIYTLVGEDRFRTILVTSDTQADGKTEISAADLNDKIIKFRTALQDVRVDPRPLGKELYDILIKPIEKQLDGAKAKTLLWSLDGNLRLLPLAALWDGNQYFGQKYENVTVTLASRTRLGDAVSKDWRVLGLGVSEGKTVKRPDGTRDETFAPLFAVKEELNSIVKSAPEETGVLDGQRLLNSEFTEDKLKKELPKGYKVVHIASHFSLNPGDATQSFLLLGDGTVLTVNEIKISPQLKFNGVELLTLSACQTAVVEKDSTGKEIEGFGYVAQQKGAEAILATLWNVADESTQIFMSEFYRLRKENPQMTKTEAIRLVQKAMITGKFQPQTEEGKRRSGVYGKSENKAQTFAYDSEKPFAHPYFWSPFVLIGNWK